MRRPCDLCGQQYEAKTARSRFCSTNCRVRNHQGAAVTQLPRATASADEPALVSTLRLELEEAGRLETTLGQQALALASRIAEGQDTGSAVAALNKELRATREEALANSKAAASPLDELRERRKQRLGA